MFFASKIEPLVKHVSSFSVPFLNFNDELIGAITIVGILKLFLNQRDHYQYVDNMEFIHYLQKKFLEFIVIKSLYNRIKY